MARKYYNDWRVWLVVLIIIIIILWFFYGGREEQEFLGAALIPKPDRKKKAKKRRQGRMTSEGEEHCRKILQDHFRCTFEPTRDLEWLKSPQTKRNLELDGYNKELGIAFEFNGRQHYEYVSTFHKTEKDFLSQVQRDKYKQKCCQKQKVWLIVIPYHVAKSMRKKYIVDRLPENIINDDSKYSTIAW